MMKPRIFANINRFSNFIDSCSLDYSKLHHSGVRINCRIFYLSLVENSDGVFTFDFMKIGCLGFHNRKAQIKFRNGFIRNKFGEFIPAQNTEVKCE